MGLNALRASYRDGNGHHRGERANRCRALERSRPYFSKTSDCRDSSRYDRAMREFADGVASNA